MDEDQLEKIRQAENLIQDVLSDLDGGQASKEFFFLGAAIDELQRAADGDL